MVLCSQGSTLLYGVVLGSTEWYLGAVEIGSLTPVEFGSLLTSARVFSKDISELRRFHNAE